MLQKINMVKLHLHINHKKPVNILHETNVVKKLFYFYEVFVRKNKHTEALGKWKIQNAKEHIFIHVQKWLHG